MRSTHTDPELRAALRHVYSWEHPQAADRALARVVWSRLSEPGDAAAGSLTHAVGPDTALSLLLDGGVTTAHLARATHDVRDESAGVPQASQLRYARERWLARLDRAATLADLAAAAKAGLTILTPECAEWPEMLQDLGPHAPQMLWVRGQKHLLNDVALAVVGARACTSYGAQVTADLTAEACAADVVIVSGAAYGIDAVAHRTALATNSPTIAVLAGGADRPYPAAHDQLLARIADQGLVCSELPPGAAPTRWRFLQRNRLIAALAHAVLVTEAGMRSGTLNTAGHAAELGRAIGAVPGPVTSAASAGCHRLVREYDATLITNGQELLELLGTMPAHADEAHAQERELSLHVRIVDALPLRGSRSLAEVAAAAGIDEHQARGALAELELLGKVRCGDSAAGGRRYSLQS